MESEAHSKPPVEVRIHGQLVDKLPDDLYIPPDALRVFLEAFQGPLDLLLYLIRKQNIDILNIPIVNITQQYMEYVELMREFKLELAAEYLVMAAMLAEIKSRLLLPQLPVTDDEEQDPRHELVRRLQEYERFKQAAQDLDQLPRLERDVFHASILLPPQEQVEDAVDVTLKDLYLALQGVLKRAELYAEHQVLREPLSIRERMSNILSSVSADQFTLFVDLFTSDEGRMGVVVTLIAILELIRQSVLELVQAEAFAPIYIKARG